MKEDLLLPPPNFQRSTRHRPILHRHHIQSNCSSLNMTLLTSTSTASCPSFVTVEAGPVVFVQYQSMAAEPSAGPSWLCLVCGERYNSGVEVESSWSSCGIWRRTLQSTPSGSAMASALPLRFTKKKIRSIIWHWHQTTTQLTKWDKRTSDPLPFRPSPQQCPCRLSLHPSIHTEYDVNGE